MFDSLKNTAWYNLLTFQVPSEKVNVSLDHQSKIFQLALCSLGKILLLNQVFLETGQIVWRERPVRGGNFFFFFLWWARVHCMLEYVFPSF